MSEHLTTIKEAKRLIEMSRYDKAKAILQPLVLNDNRNYRVFSLLGYIYHKEGLFSRAIRNYKKALELNNTDIESMVNLSLIYNDLGRYQEGAELYSSAAGIHGQLKENDSLPDNNEEINIMFSRQHAKLAEVYLRYNRAGEALAEYEKAMELDPSDYSFIVEMSECLSRLGKRKVAIRNLRMLRNKRPEFTEARVKLGHLLFLEGEIGSAIEEWDSVLSDDPANAEARLYRKMAEQESLLS
ncbi:MAG: tetratricopeptide repeat protein [Oligoflexia bacterium]|nr:tetratricopeptide repeat protein [Oligoflexia bacterium]